MREAILSCNPARPAHMSSHHLVWMASTNTIHQDFFFLAISLFVFKFLLFEFLNASSPSFAIMTKSHDLTLCYDLTTNSINMVRGSPAYSHNLHLVLSVYLRRYFNTTLLDTLSREFDSIWYIYIFEIIVSSEYMYIYLTLSLPLCFLSFFTSIWFPSKLYWMNIYIYILKWDITHLV